MVLNVAFTRRCYSYALASVISLAILMHVAIIHQHYSTRHGAPGTQSYERSRAPLRAGHDLTTVRGVNDETRASGPRG